MTMERIHNRRETYAYLHHRRFPYFKVQWYDTIAMAWRDVQKSHATEQLARAAFLRGKQCRVMQVDETSRHPLP